MKKYEVMYIVNASLDDAARQQVIDGLHAIITDNGGKILKVDDWGDMTKGYYMVVTFEADNATVKEFDRLSRINANIVRYMIIKQDEK